MQVPKACHSVNLSKKMMCRVGGFFQGAAYFAGGDEHHVQGSEERPPGKHVYKVQIPSAKLTKFITDSSLNVGPFVGSCILTCDDLGQKYFPWPFCDA